jgi:hypothetical protein
VGCGWGTKVGAAGFILLDFPSEVEAGALAGLGAHIEFSMMGSV